MYVGGGMSKAITVLHAGPQHPGRGQPSRIELALRLDYLKGRPVEAIELSPYVARKLAEELIIAARIVEDANNKRENNT
jgi:hypothetical protein